MQTINHCIQAPEGMHARPAGVLAKTASTFQSDFRLYFNGQCINAKRMLSIMTLGLKQGDAIRIEIEGCDEMAAAQALTAVLV